MRKWEAATRDNVHYCLNNDIPFILRKAPTAFTKASLKRNKNKDTCMDIYPVIGERAYGWCHLIRQYLIFRLTE